MTWPNLVRFIGDPLSTAIPDGAGASRFDGHELAALYLVGCLAAFALHLVHMAVRFFIVRITKNNILAVNLKKLKPPASLAKRLTKIARGLAVDTLFSWGAVLVGTWIILALVLRTVREALSSVPPNVKQLWFPLKNNADLAAEAVWAYVTALRSRGAIRQPLDEPTLASQLEDLSKHLSRFDKGTAIRQLRELDGVDPTIIAALARSMESRTALGAADQ